MADEIQDGAKKMREAEEVDEQVRQQKDIELKDSDDDDEARGLDAGRRKVKQVHNLKLPNEEEVREHYWSGHKPKRWWCVIIVFGVEGEKGTIPRRAMRRFLSATWTTACLGTSMARG